MVIIPTGATPTNLIPNQHYFNFFLHLTLTFTDLIKMNFGLLGKQLKGAVLHII